MRTILVAIGSVVNIAPPIHAVLRADEGSNIYNTSNGFSKGGAVSGGPAYYAGAEVVYSF